jgi:hypothetical protein
MSAVAVALVVATGAMASHQQPWCSASGGPAWSEQVRRILPDCETRLLAPDGQTRVIVSASGEIRSLTRDGRELGRVSRPIEPPAMLSWAPDSSSFFINDGEGSGMTSTFRMFRLSTSSVTEEPEFDRQVVDAFRQTQKCGTDALNPDLWGFGWTKDARQIYILATPTVHQPCGESSWVYIVDTRSGSILARLTEEKARERLGAIVPPEFRRK